MNLLIALVVSFISVFFLYRKTVLTKKEKSIVSLVLFFAACGIYSLILTVLWNTQFSYGHTRDKYHDEFCWSGYLLGDKSDAAKVRFFETKRPQFLPGRQFCIKWTHMTLTQ